MSGLGELSFKVLGVEATLKKTQVQAAAALAAAAAAKPEAIAAPNSTASDARAVANVISELVTPRSLRRASNAMVLWVDDRPDNNRFERQALEALGIRFALATSTEDALEKTQLAAKPLAAMKPSGTVSSRAKVLVFMPCAS